MMENSERFLIKSKEDLGEQVKNVSESIGHEVAQPFRADEIMEMPLDEIKRRFPVRYDMYLKSMRQEKAGKTIDKEEKCQMAEWLDALNNLDLYIALHKSDVSDRTLRERQFTVFEDIRNFLEEGGREGYVKLPTGAGKTVIFSEFIEAIGLKTLIVVPTQLLIEQTKERLSEFAQEVDVGRIYASAKEHGRQVTITTYQSLLSQLGKGEIYPREYGCLILDEAHTALTKSRMDAIRVFENAIKLGFTATPVYSQDKQIRNILNTEIHNLGIREAVEERILCSFSVILAQTEVDLSGVRVTSDGEYSGEDLERAVNVAGRNKSAVELYQKMFLGQQAIAYCTTVAHAVEVAALFNEQNISAAVINGDMSINKQVELKEKFHRGEINVLCNADILIPGFDEPRASICLNLRPTRSAVIAEQRGGRVLRLNPDSPTKHAVIVDFLDRQRDRQAGPITFAEIVDGAEVSPNFGGGSRGGGGGMGPLMKPEITIEGLNVITRPDEVMRIVSDIVEQGAEVAPEGWMTKSDLAAEVKRTTTTLDGMLDRYRNVMPDGFAMYKDKSNRLREHYSPELVRALKADILNEEKPEGWLSREEIGKKVRSDFRTIGKIAERQRGLHPDWFRKYTFRGHSLDCYAPPLIEYIENILLAEDVPFALEGWYTTSGLSKELVIKDRRIKKIAEEYRTQYPDWFQLRKSLQNQKFEYYSPELVREIKQKISQEKLAIPEALPGWMSARQVSREGQVKAVNSTIRRAVNMFRASHPEWFRRFRDKNNKFFEAYAPELVAEIKKHFGIESKDDA